MGNKEMGYAESTEQPTEQIIELYKDTNRYINIKYNDFNRVCDANDVDTLENTIEILKDTGNIDGIYELFEGLLDEL